MTNMGTSRAASAWLGLVLFSIASCAAREREVPRNGVDSPPSTPELVRVAERALNESLRLDYRRPFVTPPYDRTPLRDRYLDACRSGDQRSCWMAQGLHNLGEKRSDEAIASVREHCRRGHLMSCRAIPVGELEPPVRLPGWAGRLSECRYEQICDQTQLARECEAGFAVSCFSRNGAGFDRHANEVRTMSLARDGCRAGLLHECNVMTQSTSARDRVFGAEHACVIAIEFCDLAASEQDPGDPAAKIRVRDYRERHCQHFGIGSGQCPVLAKAYRERQLPEPVPSRGRDLENWIKGHE